MWLGLMYSLIENCNMDMYPSVMPVQRHVASDVVPLICFIYPCVAVP